MANPGYHQLELGRTYGWALSTEQETAFHSVIWSGKAHLKTRSALSTGSPHQEVLAQAFPFAVCLCSCWQVHLPWCWKPSLIQKPASSGFQHWLEMGALQELSRPSAPHSCWHCQRHGLRSYRLWVSRILSAHSRPTQWLSDTWATPWTTLIGPF